MSELFDVHHQAGHDGAPGRTTYAPQGRPRDRATVQANHNANSARAGGKYDAAILEWLETVTPYAPGEWSKPFRFEYAPGFSAGLTVASFVRMRTGHCPAADTSRRRGTALADRFGFELSVVHGSGLYRATRKPRP